MSNESIHDKIGRNRTPRVHITYDVEVGDATESKELPMVLGVVGDFAGHNSEQPKLKERPFTQIDRDNFDDVMKGLSPSLNLQVPNRLLEGAEDTLGAQLNFNSLNDFNPDQVAKQVEPLRQLLDIRAKLSDLRNKMVGNDKLEEALDQLVQDTEKLQTLSAEFTAPTAPQGE